MDLAESCYSVARSLPGDERYGLRSQLQRAAVSIPSNIAEGSGRRSDKEYVRFLRIAYGSACEVETQAELIQRVGYSDKSAVKSVVDQAIAVRMMLSGLIRHLLSNP